MDKKLKTPEPTTPFERFTKAILAVPADELAKAKERYDRDRQGGKKNTPSSQIAPMRK